MKIKTWLPVPAKEPRTLADVPSSREKPVLCWIGQEDIYPAFVDGSIVMRKLKDGTATECMGSPSKYELYSAPNRPTKLEDVPDRRIVLARFSSGLECLLFREFGIWYGIERDEIFSDSYMRGQDNGETPVDWQLTDHVAELVETEIGVVG